MTIASCWQSPCGYLLLIFYLFICLFIGITGFHRHLPGGVAICCLHCNSVNLRRVGKVQIVFVTYFNRLWAKVHQFLKGCDGPFCLQAVLRLYASCFLPIFVVKSRSCRKTVKRMQFGAPVSVIPKFWTCGICKSDSLSNMWNSFVEFHSVSFEGNWRRKKKKQWGLNIVEGFTFKTVKN